MGDGWVVVATESFQAALERGKEFSWRFVGGTLFPTQFEGRDDGCQGVINGLNFDFMSVTESTRPDPCSITGEDDGLIEV